MANLAQIAGLYSFLLVGWRRGRGVDVAVTAVGVVFIAVDDRICVIGIELSARTQVVLLGAEIITLALVRRRRARQGRHRRRGPDVDRPEPARGSHPFAIDSLRRADRRAC